MKILLTTCLCLSAIAMQATVRLPHIFADNMVLQRDKPIKIWGWADRNETVIVSFNNQKKKTKADAQGNWSLSLAQAPIGGPYVLEVRGKGNTIDLKNILVGDVWLCSGQSNMEMPVHGWGSVYNYEEEIQNADYPGIRAFNVVKGMDAQPRTDLEGSWDVCSPNTVANYSAVAYFFARQVNQELNIPIGIINSSWGGTEVETWISSDVFDQLPSIFKDKYKGLKITDFDQFVKDNEANKQAYLHAIANDPGETDGWYRPNTSTTSWQKMQIPQSWESVLGEVDGIVWFRYDFTLPNDDEGKNASLQLGTIDDNDEVWINGIKIGASEGYNINRLYDIPADVLKHGNNVIAVKVTDTGGGGGIYGNANNLYLKTSKSQYPIAGEWLYKPSVTNKEFEYVNISPNMYNSLLYNAMISPIVQLPIKGAIWYQGESNAGQAYNYRTLFPTMINDWRTKWGYEFPFYWVQLANYMSKDETPKESDWAKLREAQALTLSLPHTGQAVITDIGDADDIHPRNKQDVGKRLAQIALYNTYGKKDIVCSGPTFKSMTVSGNKVYIEYDNIGQGLLAKNKYGYIEGFAVAGLDRKFEWAQAYLDGDKVVVSSNNVSEPVAVRYSWANNPDVNLFNKEGLPAAPFRTDTWGDGE